MQAVLISLGLLGGLGLVFGLILAFAAKKFAVESDPRADQIEKVLPGANCGACGFPGCRGVAEAIVEGRAAASACPVGKAAAANQIAEIMGVAAGSVEPQRAVLLCNGGREECPSRFTYVGVPDCAAAGRLAGGPKSCEYGCLGLGSCVSKCPFGAIRINERGIAEIGPNCIGCGICVGTCPRGLLVLASANDITAVACCNKQRGPEVRKICKVGCIACGLCVKNCPENAITLADNVAVIDQSKCTRCGACIPKCPTKTIVQSVYGKKKDEVQAG